MSNNQQTITIDEVDYMIEGMDDEQKSLVNAINYCDVKGQELQNEIAALKTARQAYVNDLGQRLKK
jgi:cell division protein ZapA (FtsZ GTPase activity inhibitor)